jgi:DNA-binding GntR family transcriptional regulator
MNLHSSAKSLSQQIGMQLRAEIATCRLWPGTKLQIEPLAARFSVSLSVVREALSKLSSEGLVVSEPQRGFWVADISLDDLVDLGIARMEVEAAAIRRSIQNGDATWEKRVTTSFERLDAHGVPVDPLTGLLLDEWEEAHKLFHESLVDACNSTTLLTIRKSLAERAYRYRRLSGAMSYRTRDARSEHQAIFQATLKRDEALASALTAAHIRATVDAVVEAARNGSLKWIQPTVA